MTKIPHRKRLFGKSVFGKVGMSVKGSPFSQPVLPIRASGDTFYLLDGDDNPIVDGDDNNITVGAI